MKKSAAQADPVLAQSTSEKFITKGRDVRKSASQPKA